MNALLLTGDPAMSPASFTRFVLPFSCRVELNELSNDKEAFCFYESQGHDWFTSASPPPSEGKFFLSKKRIPLAERKNYLTPETGRVLYESAKWFVLKNKDGSEIQSRKASVKIANRSVVIALRPPGVILFDYDRLIERGQGGCCSSESSGQGMLVQEAWFPQMQSTDVRLADMLFFNELFRYWQKPFAKHPYKEYEPQGRYMDLKALWESDDTGRGAANYKERWEALLNHSVTDRLKNCLRMRPAQCHQGILDAENFSDNRAYVWTCAVKRSPDKIQGSIRLKNRFQRPHRSFSFIKNEAIAEYQNSKALDESAHDLSVAKMDQRSMAHESCLPWLMLLNVDQPGGLNYPPSPFERSWVLSRTYTRWAHTGALYGFTSHSGVMMTGPNFEPPTWQHFREIYFDQALLLLHVRVSIFKFSERISRATQKLANKLNDETLEEFDVMLQDFTQFTNFYRFPLISNQQQAVEMYVLMREQMDVNDLYEEVRSEIQNTREFLATMVERKQAKTVERLTLVAAVGLCISILLSAWGIDSAIQNKFGANIWVLLPGIIFGMSGVGILIIVWRPRWLINLCRYLKTFF